MLDKGIIERIVLDYKDIYKQALEDNLQSPAELPYFEGDFWPNVLEENIRELEQVIISYATRSALFKLIPNMLVGTYPTLTLQNIVQNTISITNVPRTPNVFQLVVDGNRSIYFSIL